MRQLAWAGHGPDHGQRLGGEAEAELAEAVEGPRHRHGHHQGQDLQGHSEWGWALGWRLADQESAHAGAGAGAGTLLSTHCCAAL